MKRKKGNNGILFGIAFLLAVVLWIFVVREDNPNVDINLGKITVSILNENVMYDNNLSYKVTNNIEVSVTVTVPQANGWKISASDISLTADLSNWHPGFASVPIDVEVKNNSNLIKKYFLSETVIKIETEQMEEKQVEVKVDISGTPKDGYVVQEINTIPSAITVKAPSSELKRISYAKVSVSKKDYSADFTAKKNVTFYDGNDDEIDMDEEQIFADIEEVTVNIVVSKEKKVSIINPSVEGTVAKGYRLIKLSSSIDSVSILGSEEKVDKIKAISLVNSKINIDKAKENVRATYKLKDYLPKGIILAEDSPENVEITANIEQLDIKTFTIKSSQMKVTNLSAGNKQNFVDDTVTVSLRGLKEDLEKITVEKLSPVIDLTNCKLGEQKVRINLTLPENIEELAASSIKIEILKT